MLCTVVAFEPSYDDSGGFQVKCTYHFKNDHADPCVLHCYFASCYGSLHKRSIHSDDLFLGYDPCLNATKDFWYGNFSEASVEFSVRGRYGQQPLALLSCEQVWGPPTIHPSGELLWFYCAILAGICWWGKNQRCHDNKRDNEAEPGGSGFKNGAESTTNDLKVYSRRPKWFKEIKWNCFIWPK